MEAIFSNGEKVKYSGKRNMGYAYMATVSGKVIASGFGIDKMDAERIANKNHYVRGAHIIIPSAVTPSVLAYAKSLGFDGFESYKAAQIAKRANHMQSVKIEIEALA